MGNHVVCLSFDFDTFTGFVARGQTTPSSVSRGEFGVVGADRLLKLLARHQIHATWFIPGITIATYPEICRRIVDEGHEVGHHSWSHIPPARMEPEDEEADLVRANEAIKDLTGDYANGYRSPSWDLSESTLDLLLKHGFVYDSSLMGHDYEFYRTRTGDLVDVLEPLKFGPQTKLIEAPIAWSLDDAPHFEYHRREGTVQNGLKPADGVLSNWMDDFRYMVREYDQGVITYTCHPYIIGRGHRMLMMEQLIDGLRQGGAVFRTMGQAAADYDKSNPFAGG